MLKTSSPPLIYLNTTVLPEWHTNPKNHTLIQKDQSFRTGTDLSEKCHIFTVMRYHVLRFELHTHIAIRNHKSQFTRVSLKMKQIYHDIGRTMLVLDTITISITMHIVQFLPFVDDLS